MDGDDTIIVFLGVADKTDNAGDGISAMRDREREREFSELQLFFT